MVLAEISRIPTTNDVLVTDYQEKPRNDTEPPQPKKTKMTKLFAFLEQPQREVVSDMEGEFQAYLDCESPQALETSRNPLNFWKDNAQRYPNLAQVARKVFTVPATSAPVERAFSQAGKILRSDRSRLLPKNFENLVFLKVNKGYLS